MRIKIKIMLGVEEELFWIEIEGKNIEIVSSGQLILSLNDSLMEIVKLGIRTAIRIGGKEGGTRFPHCGVKVKWKIVK